MKPLAAFLLLFASPAAAHDFWIAPDAYTVATPQAEIRATFRVGTAAEDEDWNARADRVVAIRSFGPDGVSDQQVGFTPGKPGFVALRLDGAGSHIVVVETTPAESDLPATEFNPYLDHEGLTAVREWRAANGQSDKPGRESYARRAKSIVQIGAWTSDVSRPLGLSLEIVPELNPAALEPGGSLPVRLYFRGKPLAGARIAIESLSGIKGADSALQTDGEGRARFAIPRQGAWKIATVWSVPVSGNPRADFDTLFASLTFGY